MAFVFVRKLQQVNGGDSLSLPFSAEMDTFKAEILREIRTEVQKAKQEIIDGEFINLID